MQAVTHLRITHYRQWEAVPWHSSQADNSDVYQEYSFLGLALIYIPPAEKGIAKKNNSKSSLKRCFFE